MKDLAGPDVVVATLDANEKPCFVEAGEPARFFVPDIVDVAYVWESKGIAEVPHGIGAPPADISFPVAGGTKFGLVCFAPNSAGKFDEAQRNATDADYAEDGMHMSDTIDYDVCLSGKVDVVLEGGAKRTLRQGSMIIMGGVNHTWQNPYDEPCVMATIVVGAHGKRG
jgi:hypothetical protein